MKSWSGKDTDQNISARSLTVFIFAVGWALVDHNPNMWVSDATAGTFSVKCFNPLKLYPLSGNIFIKWFASYFLLGRSSRQRERLSASVLSISSSVCLSVAKMQKNAILSKTKQFRATVFIDNL